MYSPQFLRRITGVLVRTEGLSSEFGVKAFEMVLNGQFGQMVAYHHPNLVAVPLAEAIAQPNLVTIDSDLVNTAKGVDISLGF